MPFERFVMQEGSDAVEDAAVVHRVAGPLCDWIAVGSVALALMPWGKLGSPSARPGCAIGWFWLKPVCEFGWFCPAAALN